MATDYHQAEIDRKRAAIIASHSAAISFATNSLKAAALISGGASVALLTYAQKDTGLLPSFKLPLLLFVSALLSSSVASGFSYFAQTAHSQAEEYELFMWYPAETGSLYAYRRGQPSGVPAAIKEHASEQVKAARSRAKAWRTAAIVLMIAAHILMFGGFVTATLRI